MKKYFPKVLKKCFPKDFLKEISIIEVLVDYINLIFNVINLLLSSNL